MTDRSTRQPGEVRFHVNGRVVSVERPQPTRTLLQYLREDAGLTGTKEGCAEGDCGACTVIVRDGSGTRVVNSCIQFLPTLHGKRVVTVEGLQRADGALHPAQQAMVDCHGSQCGFCTPGFVMSLAVLHENERDPDRAAIDDALSGNLCRCTGYRSIIAAVRHMYALAPDAPDAARAAPGDRLDAAADVDTLDIDLGSHRFTAPRSLDALAAARLARPDATLLAGGTDVALWVTKARRELTDIIFLGGVDALRGIDEGETLTLGAGVTLQAAQAALTRHAPALGPLLRRFASPPIRSVATIGGNIANGSPIGDMMPALIALGATLVLQRAQTLRELALEDFYVSYGRTALEAGEFVRAIRLGPAPRHFRVYKLSKRFDQDISAVCGAFAVTLDGARVAAARVAFGGMAAVPKRARGCEQALLGGPWSEAGIRVAMNALGEDFTPIGDVRASAGYRTLASANLLRRFFFEVDGGRELHVAALDTRAPLP